MEMAKSSMHVPDLPRRFAGAGNVAERAVHGWFGDCSGQKIRIGQESAGGNGSQW